jgi:hypothetical protein
MCFVQFLTACGYISTPKDIKGRHITGHVCMVVSVQRDGTGRPSIIGPIYMVVSVLRVIGIVHKISVI